MGYGDLRRFCTPILPEAVGDWIKQIPPPWGSYIPAVLCLGLYTSVRIAEQTKAAIQSLPRGQSYAGTAMGLTQWQTYRYVILPQAVRIILPPLTSEFMNIIKNSSVALTIGVLELTAQARQISEYTYRTFEAFTVATIVYVLITLTVTVIMQMLEKKVRVPGYIGSAGK